MRKVILSLLVLASLANACGVCDAIEASQKKVDSTYAIAKTQLKVYGRDSKEYKKAKAANKKAWKSLRQAQELPVSHGHD